MKYIIVSVLIITFYFSKFTFAQNIDDSSYSDITISQIIISLKDIQNKIIQNQFETITKSYCLDEVVWEQTSCEDTIENKLYNKNSKELLEKIKTILLSARFSRILIHNPDSIRLSFWWGTKENFPKQNIKIVNSIHEPGVIFNTTIDENDNYSTTGGYSVLIRIVDKKIIIFKIIKAYSC